MAVVKKARLISVWIREVIKVKLTRTASGEARWPTTRGAVVPPKSPKGTREMRDGSLDSARSFSHRSSHKEGSLMVT